MKPILRWYAFAASVEFVPVLSVRILRGDTLARESCAAGRVALQWKYYATH